VDKLNKILSKISSSSTASVSDCLYIPSYSNCMCEIDKRRIMAFRKLCSRVTGGHGTCTRVDLNLGESCEPYGCDKSRLCVSKFSCYSEAGPVIPNFRITGRCAPER